MLTRLRLPSAALLQVSLLALRASSSSSATTVMGNKGLNKGEVPLYTSAPEPKVKFSEDELRERLSAEEYRITQEKGTERPGTGELGLEY